MTDFSDLFPTILEIAGVPVPNFRVIDGVSFLPQLMGGDGEHREIIYSSQEFGTTSNRAVEFVRDKQWKLIIGEGLYDVTESPRRERLVSTVDQPAEAEEARSRLQAFYDGLFAQGTSENGVDSDGDGQTDYFESSSGSDPVSGRSRFEVEFAVGQDAAGEGRIVLRFPTKEARHYVVEKAGADGLGGWTPAAGPITGTGSEVEVPLPLEGAGEVALPPFRGTVAGAVTEAWTGRCPPETDPPKVWRACAPAPPTYINAITGWAPRGRPPSKPGRQPG
jgi:hypothetical protein